jgi:hypothetical protein
MIGGAVAVVAFIALSMRNRKKESTMAFGECSGSEQKHL